MVLLRTSIAQQKPKDIFRKFKVQSHISSVGPIHWNNFQTNLLRWDGLSKFIYEMKTINWKWNKAKRSEIYLFSFRFKAKRKIGSERKRNKRKSRSVCFAKTRETDLISLRFALKILFTKWAHKICHTSLVHEFTFHKMTLIMFTNECVEKYSQWPSKSES